MLLATAGAVILVALVLRPKPVAVEAARAIKGPLQVTVDEDGETRAHDRFALAAPIAGRLSRIEFHEGDEVGAETILATISPLPLDAREIAEIRARIQSAEARKREAEEEVARWESDHAQAGRDLNRARQLAKDRIIAQQEVELSAPLEIGSSSADDVVGGLCRGDAGGGTPSEGVWGTPQLARTRSELYNSF